MIYGPLPRMKGIIPATPRNPVSGHWVQFVRGWDFKSSVEWTVIVGTRVAIEKRDYDFRPDVRVGIGGHGAVKLANNINESSGTELSEYPPSTMCPISVALGIAE